MISILFPDVRFEFGEAEGEDRVVYTDRGRDFVLYQGTLTRIPGLPSKRKSRIPEAVSDRVQAYEYHVDRDAAFTTRQVVFPVGTTEGVLVVSMVPSFFYVQAGYPRARGKNRVTTFWIPQRCPFVARAWVRELIGGTHSEFGPYSSAFVMIALGDETLSAAQRAEQGVLRGRPGDFHFSLPRVTSDTWIVHRDSAFRELPEGGVDSYRGKALRIGEGNLTLFHKEERRGNEALFHFGSSTEPRRIDLSPLLVE